MTVTDYLSLLPTSLFGNSGNQIIRINNGYLPPLDDSTLEKAEESLGIDFLSDEGAGNLCFIQSSEIQPVFRTSFDQRQLLDVFYACHIRLGTEGTTPSDLYLPSNTEDFWTLEGCGARMRNLHLLQFHLPSNSYAPIGNRSFRFVNQYSDQELSQKTRIIKINSHYSISGVPEEVWSFSINNQIPAKMALEKLSPMSKEDLLTYQKILYAIQQTMHLTKKLLPFKIHPLE